jgi:hypothetical protein
MHPLPFFFAMLVPSLAWPRRDFNLLFQRTSLPTDCCSSIASRRPS